MICPSVYAFKKTGNRSGHPDLNNPYHWIQSTVRDMLSNRFYVGDTVNFKTYTKSNKLKKRIKNEPEHILIFENTHEAIIDRKTFDLVQKHFEGRKRPDAQGGKTGGDRRFVPQMALAAKAFGATGYFFEVHPDPDKGLSDAANMLELEKLEGLIKQLLS